MGKSLAAASCVLLDDDVSAMRTSDPDDTASLYVGREEVEEEGDSRSTCTAKSLA